MLCYIPYMDTNPNFDEKQVLKVADEIKRYLHACPTASDSLNGIAGWWLVRQRINENLKLVEKALENLKEEGFVEANTDQFSDTVYSLKKTDNQNTK